MEKTEKNILSQEIETYEKHKEELLRDSSGKFVLIKKDKIINTFDTYKDAMKVGIDKFGNQPFLVKQILAIEPVYSFTSINRTIIIEKNRQRTKNKVILME